MIATFVACSRETSSETVIEEDSVLVTEVTEMDSEESNWKVAPELSTIIDLMYEYKEYMDQCYPDFKINVTVSGDDCLCFTFSNIREGSKSYFIPISNIKWLMEKLDIDPEVYNRIK